MKEKIILIGGGGHCRSCIDVIEAEQRFQIAGIVDVKERLKQKVLGYEIVACDEDLPKLVKQCKYFLITIGQIKKLAKRKEIFTCLKKWGADFPAIISPLAAVSTHAVIGEGTIVMHRVIVNANAVIGKNCILNTAVIIEHDTTIADNCHIAPGAIINGACRLGGRAFIGSNSVIGNNISIVSDIVIGAGAVVIKSISQKGTYAGNPARLVHKNA